VLVHDWLTGMRGGEKVLESFAAMFPDADILTLVHRPGAVSKAIEGHRIRTSLIQRLPGATRWYRQYLPLFPSAIETFDLDDVDVVISTSHCAAKAVVPTGRAVHLCYCHSPMRYAWDQFDAYFGRDRLGPVSHALARHTLAWLARWDRATARRVDRFVAISRFVADRIARYYNRRATVIYPPVDVEFFTPDNGPADPYLLVVSALVPYKRLDVAIGAAARLRVPLKVIGTGPDDRRLRAMAGPDVEFLGSVDDVTLREYYQHARALVLPAEEDFGIAPVEAMACGRPVVAFARGGAIESVVDGQTGVLVPEQSVDAFAAAFSAVEHQSFDPAHLVAHARQFSRERFDHEWRAFMHDTLTVAAAC
jgi:glycosyltransferase involved in cell wall biosynthesis